MRKRLAVFTIVGAFIASFVFEGFILVASAQTAAPCDAACRAKLEAELAAVEKEISIQNALVQSKQREGVSLERDVAILNAQIQKAKLSIKAQNIAIASLTEDIGTKKQTITKYSAKIDRERDSLAALLRRTDELDSYSLAEVALSDKPLSEFFVDVDAFQYVEEAIDQSIKEVDTAKKITEEAKTALEEKKDKETDLRYQKELEKKFLDATEAEKVRILKVTKGQEAAYKKVLQEKQARAASIRAQLFPLRDSGEIPFGKALDYANIVSKKTGIRPAFLLAIFMQESGFGKNQGSCYLKDRNTGAGVSSRTGKILERVMKPDRDVSPFFKITEKVGRDPFNTLVSCPQAVGYGGAMGAAQFIPSTWVLYEKLITRALDISAADPWNPRDAFMAAGFLLKDNGARSGSYSAERDAACRYFSGSRCAASSWAATYGSQVMSKASTIQTTMIDPLENS
ncbi:MAG: lytic murein transglycosylase [Minisyncoccota bacterium]